MAFSLFLEMANRQKLESHLTNLALSHSTRWAYDIDAKWTSTSGFDPKRSRLK
jgi:hypothetical protein